MYDIQRPEQGRLKRYAVILRVNPDLSTCPSTDSYTTHVVWADEPYDAMSTAEILSRQVRGQFTRRVVGVGEWPLAQAQAQAQAAAEGAGRGEG